MAPLIVWCGEASEFIGKHLMSLAEKGSLTRMHQMVSFSLLKLIRFLRDKHLSPSHLIKSINRVKTQVRFCSIQNGILFRLINYLLSKSPPGASIKTSMETLSFITSKNLNCSVFWLGSRVITSLWSRTSSCEQARYRRKL
jgi:hypothetical protein